MAPQVSIELAGSFDHISAAKQQRQHRCLDRRQGRM
jgi:hypothetical protein